MSRLSRLLEAIVPEETDMGDSAPGLGSLRPLERWVGESVPFEVTAFYAGRSRQLSEMERLSVLHAGVAASRRLGAATLYLGAGVEDLRIRADDPVLRQLWEDGTANPIYTTLGGVRREGTEGATARFTVGASLRLGGLVGAADASVSANSAFNLRIAVPTP